ncbi:hypothetical protein [Streptomyces sp. NPDC047000]|uniref:hypothetical protein n=1 Tax=Streptomyces sp. NPDC047000 TaxID=3155474 RepID=UPI0033E5AFD0
MRAKRTLALAASPLIAAAALALAPAAVAQAADTSVVTVSPTPAQGTQDGRQAGTLDGPLCTYHGDNYKALLKPTGDSLYVGAFNDAYDVNYKARCNEGGAGVGPTQAQGTQDGRTAGTLDGPLCTYHGDNYKALLKPTGNSLYVGAFNDAYDVNYKARCNQ